jgi:putative Holliday junction resolvase
MPVFLGLDLGEKRVGVARSDETGTIAEAFATFSYKSRKELLERIQGYVAECRPEKLIVGLPQTLGGEAGPAARKVAEVVDWLKGQISGEWVLWDERLTTAEAERILLEADLSREKRRLIRDRLAAQRILQSYLDATRRGE